MECLLVFIALVVGFFIMLGTGGRRSSQSNRLLAVHRRLAQRFAGSCRRPGWLSNPTTEFNYRSVRVVVRATSSAENLVGRGPATQLVIPWPNIGFTCEIRFPRSDLGTPRFNGLRDLQRGPDQLIRYYTVGSDDHAAAQEALNAVVALQIEKLRRTPVPGRLCVQLQPASLTITKSQAMYQYEQLSQFVDESLVLYDQIMLTRSHGVEFVEEQSAQILDSVVCRVCGEEIQDDLVFCRRCKTPHHRECWQYNGVCSVFACGESQFQSPTVAQKFVQDDTPADDE
jgi:hypothetical protein